MDEEGGKGRKEGTKVIEGRRCCTEGQHEMMECHADGHNHCFVAEHILLSARNNNLPKNTLSETYAQRFLIFRFCYWVRKTLSVKWGWPGNNCFF